MSKEILPEGLWSVVQPLLPPEKPKPNGGRPRIDDRKVLTEILFVLRTGTPWEYLPKECGWGTGMTCLNRLREWQEAGVWEDLGGPHTGPNPTDRSKSGTKRHIVGPDSWHGCARRRGYGH